MSDPSLLLEPFLDDDEDVRLVQRYASAGARTGARVGSVAGPVGAGVGAGFGGAAGFFVGYGVTGVDPSASHAVAGEDTHGTHDDDHGDHDGPVTISVTDAPTDDADG
ncbi:hypothetical protein DU504_04965 [Haloplanus salinus]|jgi:hypothetical protein|uniref:Glycine zipper domain-containing protein n=1 Tax=Haloplanus salinus TaxID=1126245 RepID=A0A368N993_9EURY|nr:hypothetical protein [Haloplanus salinus]RCU46710.1 hypothetical protein DU504_04965 [Haloplanus salinus]